MATTCSRKTDLCEATALDLKHVRYSGGVSKAGIRALLAEVTQIINVNHDSFADSFL